MDPLESIDVFARIARQETPPVTNVQIAPLVRALRAEQRWRITPLAWSAAVSAIAASVVLVFALHTTTQTTSSSSVDPISPLFNAAQVQMP